MANDKILVAIFTNRLRKDKFLFSLYKNNLKTMLDVLYKATKYMNVEDALLARKEKPKKRERQEVFGKIRDEKWLEPEIDGRIGTPNPPLEDPQVLPC